MKSMSPDLKPLVVAMAIALALAIPSVAIASLIGLPRESFFFIYLVSALVGLFIALRPVFDELNRADR